MIRLIRPAGPLVSVLAFVGCSTGDQRAQSSVAPVLSTTAPTVSAVAASMTSRPSNWAIKVTAAVRTTDGRTPFMLQPESPPAFASLTSPIAVTIVATAPRPVVVTGSPELFSAHLAGSGTLDVVGPVCLMTSAAIPPQRWCAADPAVLPIGVTYEQITAPKPIGPVLNALRIPLLLGVSSLRSGTYHLTQDVAWFLPDDTSSGGWNPAVVAIDFDVSGPS